MSNDAHNNRRAFVKMHGLGNDFVIFDTREDPLSLSPDQVRALGDRHRGIGFDQLILVGPAGRADAFMQIYNPDGSESGACGNATRCVADLLMHETGKGSVSIQTIAGVLQSDRAGNGVCVDMGAPSLDWQAVPMSVPGDTNDLDLTVGPLSNPSAVSMGNPHVVFFVDDPAAIDLQEWGPLVERHEWFPEGVNVSVAKILSPTHIQLKVWERGAGATLACGSAACAVLVAASRRGLSEKRATVVLPGGPMIVEWTDDNRVLMSGPTAISFDGTVDIPSREGAS